jgi:DnaJ like chaperone protein
MHGEGRHGPAFSQSIESRVKEGMSWIGKVVGGLVGMAGGPAGAALGVLLGHSYDLTAESRRSQAPTEDFSGFFFESTFAVMGFIAKYDGRVSESEIAAARAIMQSLRLDSTHVALAIAAFTRGKAPDYPVDAQIATLRRVCAGRRDLLGFFLEIQMRATLAGEGLAGERRRLVYEIGRRLGFADPEISGLEWHLRQPAAGERAQGERMGLPQAYAVLGVPATSTDAEIKKAYRRLMSENHPDKLVARGLPESMQDLAKEKTQRIREAYELITESRGGR